MTYILDWSSNTKQKIVIPDREYDSDSTSLVLCGRHTPNFGESLLENILHLLENFASVEEPKGPTDGQIWFNAGSKKLQVYHTGRWNDTSIYASPFEPNPAFEGQLWYDELSDDIKLFDGNKFLALLKKNEFLSFVKETNDKFEAVNDRQTAHDADNTLHLTSAQNSWIDVIKVSSTEVNMLAGIKSNIQVQIDTHKNDLNVHLTSAQNSWIDAITASSAEVNRLIGAKSNIQAQIDANSKKIDDTMNLHKADMDLHLTHAQNSWIDAITASSAEVNRLIGAKSNIQAQIDANSNNITLLQNNKVNKAGDTMTGFLTLSSDPTSAMHAATKQYVDNSITGLDMKASCIAATTSNIVLSGLQTIDGIALSAGNRVLVKNQTNKTENGIYVANNAEWTRAPDADNIPQKELTSGSYTFIESGAINGNSGWVLSTSGNIVIGTTQIDFVQFTGLGQIDAGAGLTKSGNSLNINTVDATRIVVNPDSIDLATVIAPRSIFEANS